MTEKIIKKVLSILLWALLGISLVLAIVFVVRLGWAEGREAQMSVAEPAIIWTYILLAVAAFFTIFFPILFVVQNPRKAVKMLVSLLILCAILGVSYLLADGTPIQTATSGSNPDFSSRSVLLLTDTGIIATYILVGIAILALVYTGVRSAFGK